jgi:hypothetical protein
MKYIVEYKSRRNNQPTHKGNYAYYGSQIGGQPVAQLVDALCYKPDGHGFDPDEVNGFFN